MHKNLWDAAFDFWREELEASPGAARYEWQLLCRLVLPLIGHLPPERVSDQHRQAVEFLLHRDGRSRFIVKQALRTLDVVLERERQPESA